MIEPSTLSPGSSNLARQSLSRLIWVVVLAIAVAALSAALVPWSFSFSTLALSDEAAAQIRQATGLATLSRGRAVFALLPQPHIKIEHIAFGDPSGALHIDADYFKGNLRVLPLFVGRLEIASATLLKPRLVINIDNKLVSAASAIGRAADARPDSPEAAAAGMARLGVVSLVNGSAHIASKSLSTDIVIDDIDVTIDWQNLDAPASLTGKARMRGEFGDVAAWVAAPADLLRGGRSQMTLEVKSDVLALTANGMLSMASKPEFSGHLLAASQVLPRLLELIGYPLGHSGPLSNFRLTCDAKVSREGMLFSDLDLRLAGSNFEGSLAIEAGAQKPLLSGTLATDLLALDPFFVHLQPIIGDDGQWTREPLDLGILTNADLDLRISAAQVRLTHFEMQDAALSLMTHTNRVDVSLAQAKTYRGIVKARATFILGQDGTDIHAASSVTDLDLSALSWDIAGFPELTGSASGSGNIETSGHTISELVQHLDGRILINAKQGDLGGLDLDPVLHFKETPARARGANILSARVPYENAQLGIKIQNGTAEVEKGLADGPSGHLLLSGTSTLNDRKFDLRAVVLPVVPDDPLSISAQNLNITVKGLWDHPQIAPATP